MADCQRSAVSRDCSDQIILSQAAKNIVTNAIFAAIATLAYPSGAALLGTGNGNACREAKLSLQRYATPAACRKHVSPFPTDN
ncbi:hypothetical protein [Microseira wollei]|uniref:Uncharacterized protein n=1 Tax=Microseira wollei NIES-4236 TaxID=2530354 RepID=A0AAV3XEZ8_9CYAN|nr:hypothetical protein [Microseira wollei]GET41522.1 hypothetical protein MiSe_63340 [Microseira wollei NIES-4236]